MTKVYFCLFLFLLLVPPVQAWDFCVPNEDGVMLYYNIVSEDEQSCEVAYCHHASYICDILTIPEMVILNRGNRDFGDPDTLMKVIGIGDWAFRYYCDPAGIEQVRISKPQPEGVFSLDGRRLAKTQKGLNIIRYKDGTAKKIVVK